MKGYATRVHSSLLIPSQVYNGTSKIGNPKIRTTFGDKPGTHGNNNKNNKTKITSYKEFMVRPKGRTIEQERALMEKHHRHQQQRNEKAMKAKKEGGGTMVQLKLPTVGSRESIAKAMKITPTQVVPKAVENTVMNIPYGDNSLESKGINLMRFVLVNMHGMQEHNGYAKVKEIGEAMVRHQADFGAFTETQRNWSIKELQNKIHSKLKPYFKQSKMVTSSADPVAKHKDEEYQLGGTCLIIGDPFVGRVCETKTDTTLGRWNFITLEGKQQKHLTVITAYQVNKDSVKTAKARSTWRQQY